MRRNLRQPFFGSCMKKILFWTFCAFWIGSLQARDFNILDFGASPAGTDLSTQAIQRSIDSCSAAGGGRVVVPPGTFRCGTLILRDDVELHLCRGALLKGSDRLADYPFLEVRYQSRFTDKSYYTGRRERLRYRALIFAEGCRNVALTGDGCVDGSGEAPVFQLGNDAGSKASLERPILILMIDCRQVALRNVRLRNSAYWMQCYLACDGVSAYGIKVFNHCNFNNDGIDIDSRNVRIEACEFDTDDDAVCLKSHDPDRWCENVVIRNCTVRTNCNGVKLGTGSLGGFRNVLIENILLRAASENRIRHWQRDLEHVDIPHTMLAGLAIETVDGGITENIEAKNLHMEGVQTPIFIKLGNRMTREDGRQTALRNIRISNVRATSYSRMCSSITGWPGHPVEHVVLSNIGILSSGGTPETEVVETLPECETEYPENNMFGFTLPASGLWARHVAGLEIEQVRLGLRRADARPQLVLQDVSEARIARLRGDTEETAVVMRTDSCRRIVADSTIILSH